MPHTFTQIYIHVVFAVKFRAPVIDPSWEDELFKYITGIVTNNGQKLIAINGVRDHIHILLGIKSEVRLSDLVREIKKSSSSFVNEKRFVNNVFRWQEGYGAFSCSERSFRIVANYIDNQKEHHKAQSSKDEYIKMLEDYMVSFKREYLE